MTSIAFLIYTALSMPVTIGIDGWIDERQGAFRLRVGLPGVWLERAEDWTTQQLVKTLLGGVFHQTDTRKNNTSGNMRMLVDCLRSIRPQNIDVRMRIGCSEAHCTALFTGAVRALVLSLPAVKAAKNISFEIKPDYALTSLIAAAQCIFSVSVGDIMLAAAGAAMKKRRKRGIRWSSIPFKT